MIRDAKSIYYSSIIAENKGNQKVLFQTIDQLLQRKQEPRFPTSTSSEQLANEFAAFFHEKISNLIQKHGLQFHLYADDCQTDCHVSQVLMKNLLLC